MHRTSIEGPDLPRHPQPFPIATRVGDLVFSSAIGGDVSAADGSDGVEREIASAFDNVRRVIAAAGGGPEHIGKVVLHLADRGLRERVNAHWERLFPDPASRPVRHTQAGELPAGRSIQIEFIAVLAPGASA